MILYLIIIAAFLCILRIILGPTTPDRIIAADALGALIIVVLVFFGIQQDSSMLIDVALAYAILAFIGTIAISKYLGGEALSK